MVVILSWPRCMCGWVKEKRYKKERVCYLYDNYQSEQFNVGYIHVSLTCVCFIVKRKGIYEYPCVCVCVCVCALVCIQCMQPYISVKIKNEYNVLSIFCGGELVRLISKRQLAN